MFYIYSMILFFLASIGCAIGKHLAPTPDWQTAALVFQIIFTATYIIFFISGFFHHMTSYKNFLENLNEIRNSQKTIIQKKEKLDALQKYYEEYLAKIYPDIEKDIFNKIAENQPKELVALFQQYPDLKSSVVLKKLTKKVTTLYNDLYSSKSSLNWELKKIQDFKINPWLLWMPKVPADIQELSK